jgi:hypothetical protein
MLKKIKQKIVAYIIAKASSSKMIDIVEVRTKEIGLTTVITETDIRIQNSFFLPITIVSIQTDLLNRDGLKVGRMSYTQPKKINGKSHELLTTTSEISIITSIFQAISRLLSQHIMMQSVGKAQVKFLWWIIEIPVNDSFEIHPSKLKIGKEETEEELELRKQKEAAWKAEYDLAKEKRKQAKAAMKEEVLKRRYKGDYVPKEEREKLKQAIGEDVPEASIHDVPVAFHPEVENLDVVLDESALKEMIADQEKKEQETAIKPED